MIDREKVKTGIFEMLQRNTWKDIDKERHRFQHVLNNALAMLKEQDPLAVYEDKVNKCVCGNEINRYWHPKFCGFCGRELLWY